MIPLPFLQMFVAYIICRLISYGMGNISICPLALLSSDKQLATFWFQLISE
jgi:hypothetical protein